MAGVLHRGGRDEGHVVVFFLRPHAILQGQLRDIPPDSGCRICLQSPQQMGGLQKEGIEGGLKVRL